MEDDDHKYDYLKAEYEEEQKEIEKHKKIVSQCCECTKFTSENSGGHFFKGSYDSSTGFYEASEMFCKKCYKKLIKKQKAKKL